MTTEHPPTEEEFSRHLNTSFAVSLDESQRVELKLVEVSGYRKNEEEHQGMERFSLYFEGPGDRPLPQDTYTLEHEQMGAQAIFLVPVAGGAEGYRYQAVFNYFRR